ncbi:MAG TPA: carboxypeptidase regulatory-like domain-containing protein [Polyangia bacterium]|nr:carboxypeptidase regulatory-like domain-containing protein [Polyangia bacterium]
MGRGRARSAAVVVGALAAIGALIYFAVQHRGRERAAGGASGAVDPPRVGRAPSRAPALPLIRLSEASVSAEQAAKFGELSGRVLSTANGRPVARAALTFAHGGAVFNVAADDAGAFRLAAAEPGTYQLASLTAAGYLSFAPELGHSPIAFEARAGTRVRGLTLYLTPAVEYRGVVLDPAGKPIAGAEVVRLEPLDGEPDRFASDERGEFRFHALDDSVFEARHAGFSPARARLDLAAQLSKRLTLRLRPAAAESPRTAIAGVVVDARGAAVDGALLLAISEQDSDAPAAEARAVSGADGRFTLTDLEPGAYAVTATQRGLAPARAEHVAAGTRELRLVLRAGGVLRGTVRSASGPLAAFTILMRERRGALERGEDRAESFVDAEGRYEVRGLPPGSYAVSAIAHGHARSAERVVELAPPQSPGDAVDGIDFTLGRGGRVTGKIVDAQTRAPIAGARVSLESGPDSETPLPVFAGTSSDAAGEFALGGLEPGLRTIMAAAEGHHTRLLSGLRVESDGDLGPLTVELTPVDPGEEPHVELAGVAAVLKAEGDALVIVQVMPGGGAAEAGLAGGDRVLAVDGAPAAELGFSGAIERIRGPEGTQVVLRVKRGDAAPLDVPVTRKRVISTPGK